MSRDHMRKDRSGMLVYLPRCRPGVGWPCECGLHIADLWVPLSSHNCDGKIGVSQTVGDTTVHNFGGKLGTSHTVGTTTIHNFDGKFGLSADCRQHHRL